MAFRFKTVGQEIHVWFILNGGSSYDGPNKEFYEELERKGKVELAEGVAVKVAQSTNDRYEGNSWIVFEYRGKTWRMDISEYDSWEQGEEPTEPYEVVAKPVNEVQYVRP